MYGEPGVIPQGLPHDPFKSCVIPRPIGWISTVDAQDRHHQTNSPLSSTRFLTTPRGDKHDQPS